MIENNSGLINFYYKSPSTNGAFTLLNEESNDLVNGFSRVFGTVESLEGGEITAELRLVNSNLPESLDFLVMYFDFSESFLKNFSIDEIYDDPLSLYLLESIKVNVKLGLPNQDRVGEIGFDITSDLLSLTTDGKVGIIFSTDLLVQSNYNFEPTVNKKFVLYPYVPKKGEYVPILITLTLSNQTAGAVSPKPLLTKFPKSYRELYSEYGRTQKRYFPLLEPYFDKFFSLGHYNQLYNKDYVSIDANNNFTLSSYAFSVQYYANEHVTTNLTGNNDFFSSIHFFEHLYDNSTALPKFVKYPEDTNSAGITYEYGEMLTHEAMYILLAYIKYVVKEYFNGETSPDKINRAINLLKNMVDTTPKVNTDFVSYSGANLNKTNTFFVNMFARHLIKMLDIVSNYYIGSPVNANLPYYQHLMKHINADFSGASHNFAYLSEVDMLDMNSVVDYALLYVLVVDFFDYVYKKTAIPNVVNLNSEGIEVLKYLNKIIRFSKIMNPSIQGSTSSMLVDENKYGKIVMFLGIMSHALKTTSPTIQFWHPLNLHFRLKGVKSLYTPILTNQTHTISNDTIDVSEIQEVFSDIDIISIAHYSLLDSIYTKERATTISLKVNINTFA